MLELQGHLSGKTRAMISRGSVGSNADRVRSVELTGEAFLKA